MGNDEPVTPVFPNSDYKYVASFFEFFFTYSNAYDLDEALE